MKRQISVILLSLIFTIITACGCEAENSDIPVSSGNDSSNYFIHSINHKGYMVSAPENTLSAFKLSKQMGFSMVECDVEFTLDNVPVLLHDETIDRTSNGTGKINELTFAEVRTYDFGSWKNKKYTGEKIPAFYEFIDLCRKLSLHPYIELKVQNSYAKQIKELFNIVESYGMLDNVTWISFSYSVLQNVREINAYARIGYLTTEINETIIKQALNLKCDTNSVFLDCDYTKTTAEAVQLCRNNFLPLEVWGVNEKNAILNLNPYVSGVTSNYLIAGKVLADSVK